jgi:hypothetical protein
MEAVIIREVKCENCGEPTWHRDSTIEKLIQHQSVMAPEGRRINFACPACNVLTRSLLGKSQYIREEELSQFLHGRDSYIGSFVCAKPDCESRVVLLVSSKDAPETIDWNTLDAACENGYPPEYPFQDGEWMRLP